MVENIERCFLALKTGCQWRMQPCGFSKRQLYIYYPSLRKEDGILEEIHKNLRDRCWKRQKNAGCPELEW
jgi:transposase